MLVIKGNIPSVAATSAILVALGMASKVGSPVPCRRLYCVPATYVPTAAWTVGQVTSRLILNVPHTFSFDSIVPTYDTSSAVYLRSAPQHIPD